MIRCNSRFTLVVVKKRIKPQANNEWYVVLWLSVATTSAMCAVRARIDVFAMAKAGMDPQIRAAANGVTQVARAAPADSAIAS